MAGKEVDYHIYRIDADDPIRPTPIQEERKKTVLNAEKNKLCPTELGRRVTRFLIDNFELIMDYKFTAKVENELDEIAKNGKVWQRVVGDFYGQYHPTVDQLKNTNKTTSDSNSNSNPNSQKRLVGKETATGKEIYAYLAKYGPVIQIGKGKEKGATRFISINPEQLATITEAEANQLITAKKDGGKANQLTEYQGHPVVLANGRFGYYLQWSGKNYNIPATEGNKPEEITGEEAIEIIKKREDKIIKTIGKTIKVMNGQYGPFILSGKTIAKVPSNYKAEDLTATDVKEILAKAKANPPAQKKKFISKSKKTAP